MDFARKELEKYGWKDGEGLGKTASGISKPIKAKLKFNNSGLGHKISDELINPWWQRVYDSAAKNVEVLKSGESVEVKTLGEDVKITTKRKRSKEVAADNGYGNFVKRASLTWKGEASVGVGVSSDEEEIESKKVSSGITDMTDEELFISCGGRTVHKGARHGLSMSAKLARLEQQELNIVSEPVKVKNVKKRKKKLDNKGDEPLVFVEQNELISEIQTKKRKPKLDDDIFGRPPPTELQLQELNEVKVKKTKKKKNKVPADIHVKPTSVELDDGHLHQELNGAAKSASKK